MQEGLNMTTQTIFSHRFLARITIEAETPLAIGSGERNVLTDRLVATDVNGLPYIPGTALTGLLRHALQTNSAHFVNQLFGFQSGDQGEGSRLVISSAQMVGKDGIVVDGLQIIDFEDHFYNHYRHLPVRQHVHINHDGSAEKGGKFDEQVVFKGTRFCFELELIGSEQDSELWNQLLNLFAQPTFRIGGGTRKGFGAIKIVECLTETIQLTKNLDRYLSKSSHLADPQKWWKKESVHLLNTCSANGWFTYRVELHAENFFLFGSGFGNEDADMTYVTEQIVKWNEQTGLPQFEEAYTLIPASSVKGALAHRTAFHFNKNHGIFADNLMDSGKLDLLIKLNYIQTSSPKEFSSKHFSERAKLIMDGNPAVRAIFGYAANDTDGQRGNAIFSDVFLKNVPEKKKLLNHVAIDRFTGGAMEGALFSEEVSANNIRFELNVLVQNGINEEYLRAFEAALNDLCNGSLALGGGTMRGHGCFNGSFEKHITN